MHILLFLIFLQICFSQQLPRKKGVISIRADLSGYDFLKGDLEYIFKKEFSSAGENLQDLDDVHLNVWSDDDDANAHFDDADHDAILEDVDEEQASYDVHLPVSYDEDPVEWCYVKCSHCICNDQITFPACYICQTCLDYYWSCPSIISQKMQEREEDEHINNQAYNTTTIISCQCSPNISCPSIVSNHTLYIPTYDNSTSDCTCNCENANQQEPVNVGASPMIVCEGSTSNFTSLSGDTSNVCNNSNVNSQVSSTCLMSCQSDSAQLCVELCGTICLPICTIVDVILNDTCFLCLQTCLGLCVGTDAVTQCGDACGVILPATSPFKKDVNSSTSMTITTPLDESIQPKLDSDEKNEDGSVENLQSSSLNPDSSRYDNRAQKEDIQNIRNVQAKTYHEDANSIKEAYFNSPTFLHMSKALDIIDEEIQNMKNANQDVLNAVKPGRPLQSNQFQSVSKLYQHLKNRYPYLYLNTYHSNQKSEPTLYSSSDAEANGEDSKKSEQHLQ